MIDPRGMANARDWADFVTLPLQAIGVFPRRLEDAENWKEWAFNLIQTASLQGYGVADPRGLNWVEWAFRFNEVVEY